MMMMMMMMMMLLIKVLHGRSILIGMSSVHIYSTLNVQRKTSRSSFWVRYNHWENLVTTRGNMWRKCVGVPFNLAGLLHAFRLHQSSSLCFYKTSQILASLITWTCGWVLSCQARNTKWGLASSHSCWMLSRNCMKICPQNNRNVDVSLQGFCSCRIHAKHHKWWSVNWKIWIS